MPLLLRLIFLFIIDGDGEEREGVEVYRES